MSTHDDDLDDDYADRAMKQPDLVTFKDRDGTRWGRTWTGGFYDLSDPDDLESWREKERFYG